MTYHIPDDFDTAQNQMKEYTSIIGCVLLYSVVKEMIELLKMNKILSEQSHHF